MSSPKNDRCRLAYQSHLKHARGLSEKSMNAALAALTEFEFFARHRDFRLLHKDLVISFKEHLMTRASRSDGQPLSASTIVHTLGHCCAFFAWLAEQKGYRSMDANAVDYFTPPRRELMLARTPRPKPVPTPDDIHRLLASMPQATIEQRRNRAIVAFIYLTGIRINALASLQLGHVDMKSRVVFQDAEVVRVKFSRSQLTVFFPVGEDVEAIVIEWIDELTALGFSTDDPLFPRSANFGAVVTPNGGDTLTRECWSGTGPIRKIFRKALKDADMDYFTPHAIRKTLARLALKMNDSLEFQWAWSINLGHTSLNTTLQHYGKPSDERRRDLLQRPTDPTSTNGAVLLAGVMSNFLRDHPEMAANLMAEVVGTKGD